MSSKWMVAKGAHRWFAMNLRAQGGRVSIIWCDSWREAYDLADKWARS